MAPFWNGNSPFCYRGLRNFPICRALGDPEGCQRAAEHAELRRGHPPGQHCQLLSSPVCRASYPRTPRRQITALKPAALGQDTGLCRSNPKQRRSCCHFGKACCPDHPLGFCLGFYLGFCLALPRAGSCGARGRIWAPPKAFLSQQMWKLSEISYSCALNHALRSPLPSGDSRGQEQMKPAATPLFSCQPVGFVTPKCCEIPSPACHPGVSSTTTTAACGCFLPLLIIRSTISSGPRSVLSSPWLLPAIPSPSRSPRLRFPPGRCPKIGGLESFWGGELEPDLVWRG